MRSLRLFTTCMLVTTMMFTGLACTAQDEKTTETETKVAAGVNVDDIAPDFEMRNQEQIKVSLSEFKGKKNVVLVFYPADFTPV